MSSLDLVTLAVDEVLESTIHRVNTRDVSDNDNFSGSPTQEKAYVDVAKDHVGMVGDAKRSRYKSTRDTA